MQNINDYKIMGTIIRYSKEIDRPVTTGDKSDIIEIIDSINPVLGTRISDISADIFLNLFQVKHKFQITITNQLVFSF